MSLDSFYVDVSEYEILKVISQGASGRVYEVRNITTNEHYACKQLISLTSSKDERNFVRELEILASFHNMLIIGFHGFSFHASQNDVQFVPSIYLDLAVNGSVLSQLKREFANNPNLDWTPTKRMICVYGTAYAMKILHDNNISHRDLKPGNVLLDENYYPKLTDFGFSKIDTANILQSTTGIGTPPYMAPELLEGYDFTNSIDVYAFGIMFYEILTLKPAYPKARVAATIFTAVQKNKRPVIPENVPEKIKSLIQLCWSSNPSDRPTFDQIVDFLTDKEAFIPGTDEVEFRKYIELVNQEVINMNDPLTGSSPKISGKSSTQNSVKLSPLSPRIQLAIGTPEICDFPLKITRNASKTVKSTSFEPPILNPTLKRPVSVYTPNLNMDYKVILQNLLRRPAEEQTNLQFRIFIYGYKALSDEIRELLTFGQHTIIEPETNPNFESKRIMSTCVLYTYPKSIGSISAKDIAAYSKKIKFDLVLCCFTADDDSLFCDFHQNIIDIFKKTQIGIFLFNPTNPKFKEDLTNALKAHNPVTINEKRRSPNGLKSTAVLIDFEQNAIRNTKNLQDLLNYASY